MHICGIIAEYNPFHLGHAWQIGQVRSLFGADTAVVCAMSGNFVQRGDFAVLRKHARAEAALRGGADLVLELPLPWALASAEGFARGGVGVLARLGAVETLVFGSECGDTQALVRAAACLDTADYAAALRARLTQGTSYAAAREAAVRGLLGAGADVLKSPNDNLGVEYCRAIARLGGGMQPLALPRVGAAHDGAPSGTLASASHIRALLLRGEDASAYLPAETLRIFRAECAAQRAPVCAANAERAVLARLRMLREEDFAAADSGAEGLSHRLYAAARTVSSLDALYAAAKTKRAAHARLRRVTMRAFLGLSSALPEEVPYLRVLGCTARGREVLRRAKENGAPLLTKPADVRRLSPEAQQLFALEARATDLFTLAYPSLSAAAGGSEWTTGPVIC